MNQNDLFDAAQTVISAELLATLEWLVVQETSLFQEVLEQAFQNGLQEKLQEIQQQPSSETTDLLGSMTLFLDHVEDLLNKLSMQNQPITLDKKTPSSVAKAIETIDCSTCDASVISDSIAKTNRALQRNSKENARKLFFKEFLKNWKPKKKNPIQ